MTTIAINSKTNTVAVRFADNATNEDFDAAVEGIKNGFVDELSNFKAAELVDIYNKLAGADIKRFANKATAIERVEAAMEEAGIPTYDGTPVVIADNALSLGVAKSWTDPDVRARRSQRHGVKVAGKEFPSLQAAYREFDLDMKDHREFRMALKADTSKKIKRHGKTWQAFER